MKTAEIIGSNIKEYRKISGLTQDQVASFIGVDRSMVSYYESGEREIPFMHLEKLCDLFGVELENLMELNAEERKANFAFAFRAEKIEAADLESIAVFQKVVKNYLKMKVIANEA